MRPYLALCVLLSLLLPPGSSVIGDNGKQLSSATLNRIKDNLSPLGPHLDSGKKIPEEEMYAAFYQLDFPGVRHLYKKFTSDEVTLAAQLFFPPKIKKKKGTVFLLHGYLMHTGVMSHIIGFLLQQHYTVAIFDLPGHGLSGGKRASIRSFSQYSRALSQFMALTQQQLPRPYSALGHSTGCAIIITYLQQHAGQFENIILVAPLVRSAKWYLSNISYTLLNPFIDTVPRYFRDSTSNESFNRFIKEQDPLQAHKIPLEWVRALFAWNKQAQQFPQSRVPIVIIQGDADAVVDWHYNIQFFKKKFPDNKLYILPNAKHELFNESLKLRKQVFSLVSKHLP